MSQKNYSVNLPGGAVFCREGRANEGTQNRMGEDLEHRGDQFGVVGQAVTQRERKPGTVQNLRDLGTRCRMSRSPNDDMLVWRDP